MDKCRNYLNNLKSPIKLRRMTTPELAVENPNFNAEQEPTENVYETEDELRVGMTNDVPKVVGNQAGPIGGHASFGDLGFLVSGNGECEDIDQNSNIDEASDKRKRGT